jgi:hypothetical protein
MVDAAEEPDPEEAMRKKIAVIALASGIGLTGGLLVGPGIATAADTETGAATGVGGRLAAIKDALKGLVTDKTLTQEQADKVATTLDQSLPKRGPGGPRGHHPGRPGGHLRPEAVAKALGVTVQELRTQLQAGKTLAQIAATKSISKDELVRRLVAAAEADLAADVKAGRMTQARADEIKPTLKARITEKVDQVGPGPRGHHGPPPGEDAPDAPSGTDAEPSSAEGTSA